MDPVFAGIVVYVLLQLAVGLLVSRRIRGEEDYLLAGRSLGYGLAVFTLFATWFGAETCLGAAGATYAQGLRGGRADPFGYTLCLLLMGLVLAAPLRRSAGLTLGDVFRIRFSPRAEALVVLFLVPSSILWGAAQIRALGQVLAVSTHFALDATVPAAAGVVILYTVTGGMRADVITDFVQGIALIAGLALLLFVLIADVGGIAAAWGHMSAAATSLGAPAATAAPFAQATLAAPFESLEAWLVPIIGSVTAQELAARVMACRSPRVARNTSVLAALLYLCVGLIPVALGLLAAHVAPGLEDPEQVIPHLAREHLHVAAQVMLLGALVSAILSTVDSNLLSASALLSHNVVLRLWPTTSERRKVLTARAIVVLVGLLAYVLAVTREGVYALVEEASAFGGGGMAVAMMFGLLGAFGGARAALAAMVTSMAVQIAGTYVWPIAAPMTTSCIVSLAVYALVALREAGEAKTRRR